MRDRSRNVYEMFNRILAFNGVNATDYAAIATAAAKFTEVQSASDAMEAFFAEQESGEVGAAVVLKAVLRAAIKRKMRPFARTAKALALTNPGLSEMFKVSGANNDATMIARGRDFAKAHQDNQAAFTALGLPQQKRLDLVADLDAFEDADTVKAAAQQESVGATAGIENEVDAGMDAAIVLDAIMNNVYVDDPEKLAEWTTARHVKRASANDDDDPPTPPTP